MKGKLSHFKSSTKSKLIELQQKFDQRVSSQRQYCYNALDDKYSFRDDLSDCLRDQAIKLLPCNGENSQEMQSIGEKLKFKYREGEKSGRRSISFAMESGLGLQGKKETKRVKTLGSSDLLSFYVKDQSIVALKALNKCKLDSLKVEEIELLRMKKKLPELKLRRNAEDRDHSVHQTHDKSTMRSHNQGNSRQNSTELKHHHFVNFINRKMTELKNKSAMTKSKLKASSLYLLQFSGLCLLDEGMNFKAICLVLFCEDILPWVILLGFILIMVQLISLTGEEEKKRTLYFQKTALKKVEGFLKCKGYNRGIQSDDSGYSRLKWQLIKDQQQLILFFLFKPIMQSSPVMIKELISKDVDSPTTTSSEGTDLHRLGDYALLHRLAPSGQAMLYLSIKHGRYYVLKIYTCTPLNKRVFEDQVEMFRKIESPRIIPIEEICTEIQLQVHEQSPSMPCSFIAMPYMENGDLFEWVRSKNHFRQKEGKYCALQLTALFRYLEEKNIFHRDIKPENVLIGDDYKPMIIDFGLAVSSKILNRGFVGSSRCVAPQVIKEKEYSFKSEIYSLGILFFFILTGNYPYNIAKITDSGFRLIFQKKYTKFWENFESKTQIKLSASFKDLFVNMVHHDANKRPSLDDLMDFEWMKEGCPSSEEYFNQMRSQRFGGLQIQQ